MDTSMLYAMRAMNSYVNPGLSKKLLPPSFEYFRKYSRGSTPYPRQSTLLKIIFLEDDYFTDYDYMVIEQWFESTRNNGEVHVQLDLFDRIKYCKEHGYEHFNTILNCCGRRGGKGFVGSKVYEYKIAKLLSLGNPQKYYGVEEGKDIHFDILATNFSQAQGMLYNDVKDAILNDDYIAPYIYSTSNSKQLIQTPFDIEREKALKEKQNRKNSMRASVASVVIEPAAASSTSIRGRASMVQAFDEFAHGAAGDSAASSRQIYDAATPSLEQFDKDGLIYIPSSPWSKTGKFYELYETAMIPVDRVEADPTMFCIRWPSWAPYEDWQYDQTKKRALILPPSKSIKMRSKELNNPEMFDVEFRSNFAETENPYLNAKVVDTLFEPYEKNGVDINVMKSTGSIQTTFRAHADAGRSQDLFAFALGHKEVGNDGYWHAFIDYYKVWQPMDFEPNENGVRIVDYIKVLNDIKQVLTRFNVSKYTMDQWNSGYFIDALKQAALKGELLNSVMSASVENHTSANNFQRWEAFKTAVYQGWVHIPYYEQNIYGLGDCVCLPQKELKLLVNKNGNKVDHQDGGTWPHNDLSDCLSTVVADLLSDQLYDLSQDQLSKVVGAAQGGYNLNNNGFLTGVAMPDEAMRQASQAYYESAGYSGYY